MHTSPWMSSSSLRPPSAPPPSGVPEYCPTLSSSGTEYITQQLRLYTYIWTTTGHSFWAYPLAITDDHLIAYAWDGEQWNLVEIELAAIDSIY